MRKNCSFDGFGWKGKLFLLIMAFTIMGDAEGRKRKSQYKLLEVNEKLKMLNKPPVKHIKSEDGDIIDCVDIYKQPSFDHPALKNHVVQMKPSYDPIMDAEAEKGNPSKIGVSQLWQRSGSCPKGTVPIRRIRQHDLLRVTSVEKYGRKTPYITSGAAASRREDTKYNDTFFHLKELGSPNFLQVNRSVAYIITEGYSYLGARGDINVWNPSVQEENESSSAQIWLMNGPLDNHESVESGWVVNPSVYGDHATRLFAYWTVDASKTTGCYDLICPGFIQTSNEIVLGGQIDPVSTPRGRQYQIPISMSKDPQTGNWWLECENKKIGYWPGVLFSSLASKAAVVLWGGEVYSPRIRERPHTSTQMGSGAYAELGLGTASFISNIRIMDYSLSWKFPEWIAPSSDEMYCYNVRISRTGLADPEFFFGGPGRGPNCP